MKVLRGQRQALAAMASIVEPPHSRRWHWSVLSSSLAAMLASAATVAEVTRIAGEPRSADRRRLDADGVASRARWGSSAQHPGSFSVRGGRVSPGRPLDATVRSRQRLSRNAALSDAV